MIDKRVKYITPIEQIIKFCKGLHEIQDAPFAMNYSVRGSFISIYLPIDPMINLINYLVQENIIDHDLKRYYEEKGYSPSDVYFRRFGFDFRIARHKEKHENNHDTGWLHSQYVKQVSDLKSELKSANILITSLQYQLDKHKKVKND